MIIFWGSPERPGSLSNMKEQISRDQVDEDVYMFSDCDQFLVHAFKAHLLARIFTILKLNATTDDIEHEVSLEWLRSMAEHLVAETIMPTSSDDPVYALHCTFLHIAYLYIDLRMAITYENGPHIVRLWKLWLARLLGADFTVYAAECLYHVANLCTTFPKHVAYIATHNWAVNLDGKPGRGKPLDLLMDHYNQ